MYDYDVGPGWNDLVVPLIDFVESHGGKVTSVRERFGSLRFSYEEPEDADPNVWNDFEKMVFAAEKKSETVCEYTGKPGEIRSVKGWFKCVSDDMYKKLTSVKQEF